MFSSVLYAYLISMAGTPYIWGGDDPIAGFDCSGLAMEFLQAAGALPHGSDYSSQGLYDLYGHRPVKVPRFGDLAFYGKSANRVTHVAIYLGDGRVIEAGGGGRNTNTADDAIGNNAYVRIRPWNYRGDFVEFLRPDADYVMPSS